VSQDALDREKILERFAQELDRITAATVLDRIKQMESAGQSEVTDFFDPAQQRVAERVLHHFKALKHTVWGGYPEAERARVLIYPAARQSGASQVPLAFIEIDPGREAAELSHRDYLGAVLALGLRREKIGDVLLTAAGVAQIVISPEMLPYLLGNLTAVGRFSVRLWEIGAQDLCPAVPRSREVRATVASLRLDAVASAGFGLSRSKLVPAVRSGQVKLNWQSVKTPSAFVKEGDVISLAGRGRVEVTAVLGESRKGRLQLLLKKHF